MTPKRYRRGTRFTNTTSFKIHVPNVRDERTDVTVICFFFLASAFIKKRVDKEKYVKHECLFTASAAVTVVSFSFFMLLQLLGLVVYILHFWDSCP